MLPLIPIAFLSYPLLVHLPNQSAEAAHAGLVAKAQSVAGVTGYALAPDLEALASGTGERAGVGQRLGGLSRDADVTRVRVFGADRSFVVGLNTTATEPALPAGEINVGASFDEQNGLLYTATIEGAEGAVGWLQLECSLAEIQAQQAEQRQTGALVGGVVLLLSLGFSLLLGTGISKRIVSATRVAARVADGDLSVEVPASEGSDELSLMFTGLKGMVDELRQLEEQVKAVARCDLTATPSLQGDLSVAFAELVARQRELVQELSSTSTELGSSTREILATLRQQETGSHDQASAVEEARRTMDSLLSAAGQITDAARAVHENAQRTRESSESTADRASQLSQLTSRIADVLTSITKIADKSDILALNAALEGTKAGEAGKGFILVAEEMRRLAESVVEAVRDISELVETIRQASQASVLATEQGVKLSLETATSAEMIRLTSQQQQSGTEQATHSMNEMSELIQQNVSGARQNTRAVEGLGTRASRLQELLSVYNLGEGDSGRNGGSGHP